MRTTFRRQNPLLAEMLISLLFFVICACVIICVFVSASNKSEKAVSQQEALNYAQFIAEEFKADNKSFSDFFADLHWNKEDGAVYENRTFSRSEYVFKAIPADYSKYIRGFCLYVSQNDEECFSFKVEVPVYE